MSMKKRILIFAAAAAIVAVAALVYALDIGSWSSLDMEKLRAFSQSTVILDGEDQEAAVISGAGKRTVIALDEIPTKFKKRFSQLRKRGSISIPAWTSSASRAPLLRT
jgi:membrane peptidoglycan carboxypeptidase